MYDRVLKLINQDTFSKIQKSKILLIGLGGVGGYVFEALIRSGFLSITVLDRDYFEKTNLNRQIYATRETLGKKKVDIAKDRAQEINPDITITPIFKNMTNDDITEVFLKEFDFIIDACDTVSVKEKLARICANEKIPFLSCMGTANRFQADKMCLTTLKDTYNDPLARKLRNLLKDDKKSLQTKVVWSSECPQKTASLGTICSVPMAAAAVISSYVIQFLMKESEE